MCGSIPNYQPANQSVLSNSDFSRDAFGDEGFNHVALLDVVKVTDGDTAFHAVANFTGVVFETFERRDFTFVNLHAVTHEANIGIAFDKAIEHVASSNRADLGYAERFANFGAALIGFLDD